MKVNVEVHEWVNDDIDDIDIDVFRPKEIGEGYAIEKAIDALQDRYYQIVGKKYTRGE